ncbi:MAG TPA: VOC family protein [Candidatus Limnocylindria bacterium]|nr:VOC family protein [Candidatus Limnocylindria bacterium]
MANPVTWFEIIGKDSAGLQKFYREVFGWKLTPPVADMGNYSMLEDHEPGIGGGIGEGDPRVTVYVESPDPQSLIDRATARGATVLMPLTTITPTTTIAMLRDPAGNTFGLIKANPRPRRTTARAKTTARKRTTARKKTAAKKTARRRTASRRSRRSR